VFKKETLFFHKSHGTAQNGQERSRPQSISQIERLSLSSRRCALRAVTQLKEPASSEQRQGIQA
jgi:hypothetical protein